MLGWGFADFFAKKTIDAIGDVTSLVWAHIFGTAIFVGVAVIAAGSSSSYSLTLPNGSREWTGLAAFGVGQAIIYLLVYNGFGKGQLSVLNPVFASYSGLAAAISVLFLGEMVSPLLLALIVVFAGILMMSVDPAELRENRIQIVGAPGLTPVLIASLMAAFWTVYWARFVDAQDSLVYAAIMYFFMTLFALLFAFARRIPLGLDRKSPWLFLVLIGACEALAYISLTYGFSATPLTSVIAVISGAFSLPTLVLSRAYLGERLAGVQYAGGAAIIAGIVALALQ